ncbi:hypothetical protein NMK34_23965 [Micromonospora sp. BRA006-A]|uniref:hypothetical protein n=1 Tax=Micromonospora sp. BRA006-A TaxID=2962860 RepID=UPI00296FF93C|nr:hypothetical protein [Micromonospora sp. BRA006-A]MDW3849675.1 hypothetical protein [Micromonospora sp. BRA006-A]MEE3918214.1 hypothetical protein [Micromonospora sp. BRA006-A]
MPTPTPSPAGAVGRTVRCRYMRRNDELCTAEAVDPTGDVLLCTKHLARALALIKSATRSAR